MSALTLTAGAKPVFLDGNLFGRHADKASDLLVSTGSTLRHRLYDMDPNSRWQSVGSADGTPETIEAGLWLPGMQSLMSIDYIAVMNHNIKDLTIETSANNGGAWTSRFSDAAVAVARTRVTISAPVDANRIRLTMNSTQTANEEKKIGDIIVGLARFQTAERPFKWEPEPWREGEKTAKMADGSLRGNKIYRSDAGFHFWASEAAFIADTAAELANFRALARLGKDFLFMPEPGDEVDEIYQCRIRPGTFDDKYLTLSKGGGRGVRMVLEETGGA